MGLVREFAKTPELTVVTDRQNDVPILGLKNLVRHDVGMGVSHSHRRLSSRKISHGLIRKNRHLTVEKRHINILPLTRTFAMNQCGLDGIGGVKAGHEIGDRDTHLLGISPGNILGLSGHTHQAAHRLDHKVIASPVSVRPSLAKPGDGAIDEAGINSFKRLVVETVAREGANLEILDDDIAMCRELMHDLLTPRI